MLPVPHEFALGGVYMPPMLVAAFFGVLLGVITRRLLERHRLVQYFFYPPLVNLAMMMIYTLIIGTLVIGS